MTLHIRTRGMKSHDLDLVLPGKLLLLTAPNGAGKSELMDAVRLAALGYVPALGKEEQRTALLMSGRELETHLALDDGRVIHRRLRANGDGGYSLETDCSWMVGKAGSREHAAAAIGLFGTDKQSAAEVLDVRELLKLTGPQRAARIEKLLQTDGDPATLAAALMRYTVQRLVGRSDEAMPDDYRDLVPAVDGFHAEGQHTGAYAALKAATPDVVEKLKSGLVIALDWLREEKNETAKLIQNKRRAREELAPALQETPEPDADEIAALELRRSQLERAIGAVQEQLDQATESADKIANADTALRQAEATEVSAREARTAYEREVAPITAQRDRLLAVIAELDALTPPTVPPESDAIATARRRVTEATQAAADHTIPSVPTADAHQAAVDDATRRLGLAEKSPWAQVLALATEIRSEAARSPKGRAISERADRIKAIATENRDDTRAIAAELSAAESALAEQRRAIGKAEEAQAAANARKAALDQDLAAAVTALDALRAERQTTIDNAQRAFNERKAALVLEREALRKVVHLDALAQRDRETADAVTKATAELRAAQQVRDNLGDAPATVEPVSEEHRAELAATQAKLTEMLAAQARHRQLKEVLDAIAKAEVEAIVFAALEHACKRVLADEVGRQRGPLVMFLDRYLKAAGRPEGAYVRPDRTACDFGWRRTDGAEVSIATMGGGEWTLFAAGLCAALQVLRSVPVRVLLIEAGECDATTLAQLLSGIAGISGELTAAIVAHWYTPKSLPAGWAARSPSGERVQREAVAA